jgi:hypothetical protein
VLSVYIAYARKDNIIPKSIYAYMNVFRSMAKKTTEATFDAIVNANNAITIPEATRLRLRIVPGVNVKITIETDE